MSQVTKKIPFLRGAIRGYALYKAAVRYCRNLPGHYYSPIVNTDEIKEREKKIWDARKPVHAINVDLEAQQRLLARFEEYYQDLPFPKEQAEGFRYYFRNGYCSYTDGIMLYSFFRYLKPARVIEIGSGFSSALMLDTRERFQMSTELTFIEPYPERLRALLKKEDEGYCTIMEDKLQDVPLSTFEKLEAGDILFIDSTHVSKTGSDVNYIFFEILPILKSGVVIHIHDIFDSFEYPKKWVYQKRSWNEAYLLRAFLMHNDAYEILLYSNFLHARYPDVFRNMPLCYEDAGANFWLRKN